MMRHVAWLLAASLLPAPAAIVPGRTSKRARPAVRTVRKKAPARPAARTPWRQPTYADSTIGDRIDGDDLTVRRAAVEALGRYNGSVVVADPITGRILTIVNQKLAYQSGFTPCSTVKLMTAFAALSEGLIERDTPMRLSRAVRLDLTGALARSNNPYFAMLGVKLGFERVSYYAHLFGFGEKAGLDIEDEQPGVLPAAPPANGGVGMMTSFGEGILMTPLELAALLSAVSNGGTLYYLQYPRGPREIAEFIPRVKRRLEISRWIDDVKAGMRAAVDFGTGHRANYDPMEPVLGKTGTCTDYRAYAHLGWFGSFNDVERNKLVVVVLLTGGHSVNGPVAAGVAGAVYRNLSQQSFFARTAPPATPETVFTTGCCAR